MRFIIALHREEIALHRVAIFEVLYKTYERFFVLDFKTLNGDVEHDSLLMLSGTFNCRFSESHCFGTHRITSCTFHIPYADQFPFEINTLTLETEWIVVRYSWKSFTTKTFITDGNWTWVLKSSFYVISNVLLQSLLQGGINLIIKMISERPVAMLEARKPMTFRMKTPSSYSIFLEKCSERSEVFTLKECAENNHAMPVILTRIWDIAPATISSSIFGLPNTSSHFSLHSLPLPINSTIPNFNDVKHRKKTRIIK